MFNKKNIKDEVENFLKTIKTANEQGWDLPEEMETLEEMEEYIKTMKLINGEECSSTEETVYGDEDIKKIKNEIKSYVSHRKWLYGDKWNAKEALIHIEFQQDDDEMYVSNVTFFDTHDEYQNYLNNGGLWDYKPLTDVIENLDLDIKI